LPADEGAEESPVQESNCKRHKPVLTTHPLYMVAKTDPPIVIEPAEAQLNANNDKPCLPFVEWARL